MKHIIKNSRGKQTGELKYQNDKIFIHSNNKPVLVISDKAIIMKIINKDLSVIKTLYDVYYLTIGEIASLFDLSYSQMWKKCQQIDFDSSGTANRRNSSWGQTFNDTRCQNMSKALMGRNPPPKYERTQEIRDNISKSLKKYFQNNEVSEQTRKKLSQAWIDGKYKNSNMGRGYNGTLFSIKTQTQVVFRSLFELYFILQLEEHNNVWTYSYEPFTIPVNNHSVYIPDFLINECSIVELKSYSLVKNFGGENRLQSEISAVLRFAQQNNFCFNIIYDIDLHYDSTKFQRFLRNNPNIIKKYNIVFKKDFLQK